MTRTLIAPILARIRAAAASSKRIAWYLQRGFASAGAGTARRLYWADKAD